MMNTYKVERMTTNNYNEYLAGGYNYDVETLEIQAETAKEAIKKAEKVGYVVNPNTRTLAEIETENKAKEQERKNQQAKAQARKEKRLAKEEKIAKEKGLTVEEYRKEKARKAKITKLEREIAELEKQLANKKAYLEKVRG